MRSGVPPPTGLPAPDLLTALTAEGIEFFCGVPDSLLKDLCAVIADAVPQPRHVIAANEGGAVAIAAGYHLATGKIGAVYLQNSGLGNAINPLTSLVDPGVYGIPLLLIIGWRGERDGTDEPQHRTQGRVTLAQLDLLQIPYAILSSEPPPRPLVSDLVATIRRRGGPAALVVRAGTFAPYPRQHPDESSPYSLRREEALHAVIDALSPDEIVVATTGMTSRELYEYRATRGESPGRDFLTVGSMGHSSQIALGIALAMASNPVTCIDGDGAAIMHMGSLAIIGSRGPRRFRHVLINNGAHDSVGGQPTAGMVIDFPAIAEACGYGWVGRATNVAEITDAMTRMSTGGGPALLEIRVRKGARADLGRPRSTPEENRNQFVAHLRTVRVPERVGSE